MKKIYKKILDEITPYQPGKPIEEVKRELGLENIIKLASNENAMSPSPKVIEAIRQAAKNINRYPDGGCFYLRRALAKKLSIAEENIIFGNGSDELIVLALRAFISPQDEVIISEPTFLIYKIAAQIEGARVRTIPAKNYKYDLDAMLGAVTSRTKIIFIANPDNPTGTYVTDRELKDFIERVPGDVLIFLDEAYYEFATGEDYPETLDLVRRQDCNVIVTRTFSKAYSLAGLRIGYGIARNDITGALEKVTEPFNINSLAQVAAVSALGDTEYLDTSIELVREEKKRFYQAFDSLDIEYIPSRTNFVLANIERDSQKVFNYLLKRGIIVREMSAWGLDGFIRVNIGLRQENDKFFKVFEDAVKEIPKKKETT